MSDILRNEKQTGNQEWHNRLGQSFRGLRRRRYRGSRKELGIEADIILKDLEEEESMHTPMASYGMSKTSSAVLLGFDYKSVADSLTTARSRDPTELNVKFSPCVIRRNSLTSETLQKDLPVLIGRYLKSGNNYMQEMNEFERDQFIKILSRYGIGNSEKTTLTLSRFIGCYPDVVVYSIFQNPSIYGGPIDPEDHKTIPIFMYLPCFASVIPSGLKDITDVLLQHHFEMMLALDDTVHSWDEKLTPIETIRKHQRNNFHSEILTEEERRKLLKDCDLIQQDLHSACGYAFTKEWKHLKELKVDKEVISKNHSHIHRDEFDSTFIRSKFDILPGLKTHTDLTNIILLYLKKGSNYIRHKTIQEMCELSKQKYEKLLKSYDIKCGREIDWTNKTITLGRIISSYPEYTVLTVFRNPYSYGGPIDPNKHGNIPTFMYLPCFASVIPSGLLDITEALLEHHFEMMKVFDASINSWADKFTPQKILRNYQMISFHSDMVEESKRIQVLVACGLIQKNKDARSGYTFTKDWQHLAD